MENEIFDRAELLLGTEKMERLGRLRVILFGVGGVGSWCAEALVRTGVGHITIVDSDVVATSNINRQLPATTLTVGRSKVEVMAERLRSINPDCEITARAERFTASTEAQFPLDGYDVVVDAIDSVADKALLILRATEQRGVRLFSSMGAARKLDPTRVRVQNSGRSRDARLLPLSGRASSVRVSTRNANSSVFFPMKSVPTDVRTARTGP